MVEANPLLNEPSALSLRVDFDMEMHVVVDDVLAKEAEEFAGAVVAAVGGAVEAEHALAGEAPGVVGRGDEDGELQRVGDAGRASHGYRSIRVRAHTL